MYMLSHRHNPEHWHTTYPLHQFPPLLEKTEVAPELIDYDTLDEPSVFLALKHYGAVGACEYASTVNVGHKNHLCPGITRHRHIHNITIPEIELAYASGAFHHHRIMNRRQSVESLMGNLTQLLLAILTEIAVGIAVAHWLPVYDNLRRHPARGLEQHRVHVGRTGNPRCLRLHRLRPSDFQAVGSGIGIERHVLGLEWSRGITVLPEYTTQPRCYQALADIAAGASQHHRRKSLPPAAATSFPIMSTSVQIHND